jgi:TonB-linked SusC/RagA family outer membrane protein
MLCTLLLPLPLGAQNLNISGTVRDNSSEPVAGASVVIKGSTVGVATDVSGSYTISAPANATLVFSFLGLTTREEPVNGRGRIDIELESGDVGLSEVVVVAYGTTAKERFTGSVSVLKNEKLVKGETSNVTKALEGAVSGVQISSSSGQPGISASIRVRGIGSISAGSSPLLVVDGVPYEGSLNSIAPQDIESLSVLKDAAATSMYGARGSNGVLMITTKKADAGKVRVNFEARAGLNSRGVPAYDVITDPARFYELTWEAQRNSLLESGGSYTDEAAAQKASETLIEILGYNIYKGVTDAALVDPATGKINPAATEKKWGESWLTDPFKSELRQEYNLSVSGGSNSTSAYFSFGYVDDKGVIEKSDFSRVSVRGKIDQKLKNFFKAGVNVAYAQTSANAPVRLGDVSNIFYFSQSIAPIYPIYKYDLETGAPIYSADGTHAYDFGSGNYANGEPSDRVRAYGAEVNPLYKLQNDYSRTLNDNLSSRAYVELKLLQSFTLTANIAYDIFNTNSNEYTNPTVGDGKSYGGIGSRVAQRYGALNANQLLTYSKEMDKHKIDLLLGHEIKANDDIFLSGEKTQFYDPSNPELANGGAMGGLTSYLEKYRLEGYLSRAEYSFDDRYMLSGSFRRDASSKFHPDVRWGNFWSVGAAWRATREGFLAGVEQLNNLRLRASYGTQGNDAISGSNLYDDQYEIISDGTYPSPTLIYRGAPELTWEKSTNLTVGFESRFFGKATLNIDYFIKNTQDMIYAKPLATSLGYPSWVWDNQVDMRNSGWEVEASVDVLKTADVFWRASANITALKNELTRLPEDKDPNGYQEGRHWRQVGGSLYDWYLPLYAGVDPASGKPLWYVNETDKDGNVTGRTMTDSYSEASYYEIGKTTFPDFYGGFSTDVAAYGFDLSVATAFQVGGYAYDYAYAALMHGGVSAGTGWHTDILSRWTPENTEAGVPRLSAGDTQLAAQSDRFLTSASYFSLKNVTLGYTFPRDITGRANITSLRAYVSGDNLWLASARRGFDPRQSFSGSTGYGIYAALRTVSIGLSIGL